MTAGGKCPGCGREVEADSWFGHCPACLLRLGSSALAAGMSGPSAEAAGEELPRAFGDYELMEVLGRGGMGVVFKARHRELDRWVALKMVRSAGVASPTALARFEFEAKAAARLDHPHILPLYEIGDHEGQPYFTMRLIEGASLAEAIERGDQGLRDSGGRSGPAVARPAQQRVAGLCAQIARAVHYAHQAGVLHRDLKSANILIDRHGESYLTDFGIAKGLQEETSYTRTLDLLGTPGAMAPELVVGAGASVATDVYGLGTILYELLTGRLPFGARTALETVRQVVETEPPPPSTLQRAVDPDLETICLHCLEKEPAHRYPSALAVAEDLERFLRDEPILARPASGIERAWRWARRQRALAAALATLTLVVLAGIAGVLWQWRRAEHNAQAAEQERARAEVALERTQLERAHELLAEDDPAAALAHLARLLRDNPRHHVAAQRLVSALTYRSFALPIVECWARVGNAADPTRLEGETLPARRGDHDLAVAAFAPDGSRLFTRGLGGSIWRWQVGAWTESGPPLRPEGAVTAGSFSPDGRWFATSTDLGVVEVWAADSGDGAPVKVRLEAPVWEVRFSRDGRFLAAACEDGTARVWNVDDRFRQQHTFRHGSAVRTLDFDPEGNRLATATHDGTAFVWDLGTGQSTGVLLTHDGGPVPSVRFSPAGRRLLTASDDGTARIWDSRTGQPIGSPLEHQSQVNSAEWSPDGGRVATASWDRTARLWDARTGQPLGPPLEHRHWVWHLQFSPDGQRLVTLSEDGTARLWQARSGLPLSQPLKHAAKILSAQFHPDGQSLMTLSKDGCVRIWDTRPGQAWPRHFEHDGALRTARLSPDGRRVVTASDDGTARVWEADTGQAITPPLSHAGWVWTASFSPDGRRVATASWDGTARIWDAKTGQPTSEPMQHASPVRCAQFHPDGRRLLTAARDGIGHIWDLETGRSIGSELRHGADIPSASFSPDGKLVVTASRDSTARVWDASSGEPRTAHLRHQGPVLWAEFSPDSQQVVTASQDGTARVWNVSTGHPSSPPLAHGEWVSVAGFSPRGGRVLTAAYDGTARLWNQATGEPIAHLVGHRHWIWCARFDLSGQQLGTGSYDHSLRIWHTESGLPVSEPLRHGSAVRWIEFGPGQTNVLTASADGVARFWDLPEFPSPVPSWLPQLAEWVGGQRLNSANAFPIVSLSDYFAHKTRWLRDPPRDASTQWLQWFLGNRETRAVSPHARATMPEWITRLLGQNSLASLEEALTLSPTNGVAHAQIALLRLNQRNRTPLGFLTEARFHARRAATYAAAHPATRQAAAALERTASQQPILIPERSPNAPRETVDLSDHFNAGLAGNWHGDQPDNDLSELPAGIQILAGTPFDLRGLVQLDSGDPVHQRFPPAATNIAVGRFCGRLHFLHGAIHGGLPEGTTIGTYVIRHADGLAVELPLRIGQQLRDWWAAPNEPPLANDTVVAWTGRNGKSRSRGTGVRLFKTTWTNPRPGTVVARVDFQSRHAGAGPFLLGITAE